MAIAAASMPYSAYTSGWLPGLAEAVDAEGDGADAEGAADEGERVAGAVDDGDDGKPALVRA